MTPEKGDLAEILLKEPCVFFFFTHILYNQCETISDVPKGAVTPSGIQISDLSVIPLEEPPAMHLLILLLAFVASTLGCMSQSGQEQYMKKLGQYISMYPTFSLNLMYNLTMQ